MSDVNRRIQLRINAFAAELTRLVRDAAVQAVEEALRLATWQKRAAAATAKASTGKAAAAAAGKRSVKRSAAQVEGISRRLLEHVQKNPGQGIEAIARGLSVSTRTLALPVRKLLAAGKITSSGQKRATRYFPASKGPSRRASKAKQRVGRPARRNTKPKRGQRGRTGKARRKR